MITHLQTYFAKHYRWMFVLLLGIIIVPFVFSYGPGSRLTNARGNHKAQYFFGHDLSDEAHMQEVARMAALNQWLKTGTPPQSPEELQVATLERLVKLDIVERLGIPTPSTQQLSIYIAGLPPFTDDQGFFSKQKFQEFQSRFAGQEGLSKAYLNERIAECWRIDQFASRLTNASFYLPSTLQREYGLMNATYTVESAIILAKPDASITVSDDEARTHFEQNAERYRTPEMRSGTVYRIPGQRFMAQVQAPTEEQFERFFGTVALRFIKWQVTDEKGNVTGEAPQPPTLAEHREEVLKLYMQSRAARAAAEAVDTIVQKIYAEKISPGSPAWEDLVKAAGVEIVPVGPVAADTKDVDGATVEMLFTRVLPQQPYSEAFVTDDDGRFVLLTHIQPSAAQTYEQAAAQAKANALTEKQQKALAQLQADKVASLRLAVAQAGPDADFLALARQEGFAATTPEAFKLDKVPFELQGSRAVMKGLITAQPGDLISDTSPVQATVVRLRQRSEPSFTLKEKEAQAIKAQVEKIYARLTVFGFLNEWAQIHGRG